MEIKGFTIGNNPFGPVEAQGPMAIKTRGSQVAPFRQGGAKRCWNTNRLKMKHNVGQNQGHASVYARQAQSVLLRTDSAYTEIEARPCGSNRRATPEMKSARHRRGLSTK